jgi:hypothetical protein
VQPASEHYQLLYGTRRDLDAFLWYAFKRYQDHRPYLALERDCVDQTLDRMKRWPIRRRSTST